MAGGQGRDVVVPDDGDEEAAELAKEADEAARRLARFEPPMPPRAGEPFILPALQLEPRLAHVQAGGGRELGRVPWEVHREACRRLGRDAERIAARGGLGWEELVAALGRVPEGWRAW